MRAVNRTWLGRIRVEAVNDRYQREVVVDRVTGEILRDYMLQAPAPTGRRATGARGTGSGTAATSGGSDDNAGVEAMTTAGATRATVAMTTGGSTSAGKGDKNGRSSGSHGQWEQQRQTREAAQQRSHGGAEQ